MPHLFCFGFGYSATALSRLVDASLWRCEGTHRENFGAPLPPTTTHLLISIPPDGQGDRVLREYKQAILDLPSLQWVGYLSTTGVYGDTGGAWVDERSPLNAPNARLRNRVVAEQEWLSLPLPVHIFRLSGIYGPGRSALEQVQEGVARRIDKKGQFFSRIHVEDIARVLLSSIIQPSPGAVYNVADDLPSSQEEVVRYAAELLGVPPPPLIPFEQAEISEMARSFYAANRRVQNSKIKQELGVQLQFPSYREGLAAIKNSWLRQG